MKIALTFEDFEPTSLRAHFMSPSGILLEQIIISKDNNDMWLDTMV